MSKRYLPLLLWPVAGLTLLLARCSPRFAEHVFARGIYRVYRTPISFLTGLLPCSLGELIVYAAAPAVLIAMICWIIHIFRGKPGQVLLRGAVSALSILGLVFFMFVFGCGANYYRDTYAQSTGMVIAPGTDEELQRLCLALTDRANALRGELEDCEDADGVFRLPCTVRELAERAIRELPDRLKAYGREKAAEELGIGLPTLNDVVAELLKPGRDIRDSLPKPILRTDVLSISDLKPGMKLTGTVRNVIDFGAFVDIGVHQDGLVHISEIAERRVKHPSEVLTVGDVVQVLVLDVDEKKKRISLSIKQAK